MAAQTLPVGRTLSLAALSLLRHKAAFVRLFRMPFLAMLLSDTLSRLGLGHGGIFGMGIALAAQALAFLCVIPAATAWHRLILSGPDAGPAELALGRAELRYAGFALLYCVAVTGIGAAVWAACFFGGIYAAGYELANIDYDAVERYGTLMALLAVTAAMLATARLSLVFPDAAAGRRMSLRQARNSARGSAWPLFAATFLPVLPGLALQASAGSGAADLGSAFLTATLGNLITVPLLAISVSVLSLAYLHLRGPVQNPVDNCAEPAA